MELQRPGHVCLNKISLLHHDAALDGHTVKCPMEPSSVEGAGDPELSRSAATMGTSMVLWKTAEHYPEM